MNKTPSDAAGPLGSLRGGVRPELVRASDQHSDRRHQIAAKRIVAKLRVRGDVSDVVQKVFHDLDRELDAQLADPRFPRLIWLRLQVGRRLMPLQRQYLGSRMSGAALVASLDQGVLPEFTSAARALMLLDEYRSPAWAALRGDQPPGGLEVPESLDPIDRKVFDFKSFEQFSRTAMTQVLGLTREAAGKRRLHALRRLKAVLPAPSGVRER